MAAVTSIAGPRHTGIAIDPAQLIRMRDQRALSVSDLAEKAGELLLDRDRFSRILDGSIPADAQTARALRMALDCDQEDVICGLPPGLPPNAASRWMYRNGGWYLDTGAVARIRESLGWTEEALADAASRYWFSRDSVSKIERGKRKPRPRTLRAFCQVLGCEPRDLMPGSPQLPDGYTREHRELLDYNAGMREYADRNKIVYRTGSGRIRYSRELRERYARYLEDGESAALAS